MKILLDHNVAGRLRHDLSEFNVFSARYMGWDKKRNGDLLKLMLENDFDVLITRDTKMENQQNFETYPIPVILLNTRLNMYRYLKAVLPELKEALQGELKAGVMKIPEEISDKMA